MAKVQKTVITALGEQMLFSSALTYTDATLCSQDISNLTIDQLRSLTDLTGKVLSSPISAHKRQGNTKADQVDVQVTFTNQDQKADINYSSIGWFARDHQGQETLIAVTPFIGTDTIAAAPPDGAATSSKNITLSMAAGTATEINVLIDPAGSVTPSTFNAEVDKINEALALKADNAELADYAKKADVNSALDAKADKTALDPLAKSEDVAKDVETLNSAINLKADKTDLAPLAKTEDVNTELDKKADKTALDDYAKSSDVAADVKQLTDSIATKADAKTVDDAFSSRDATIATKADKATVDAEISKIDFTPYAKSADVANELQNYTTTVDLNKLLAGKEDAGTSYSKAELDKKLLTLSTDTDGKVNADQVSSMIANKVDKSDLASDLKSINDSIATKANASDVVDNVKTLQANIDTKADKATVDAEIAKIDFTPYAKSADVAKDLQGYTTTTDLTKLLAGKRDIADSYSRDELDKKFLQLSTDTSGKVSADQIAKLLASKVDKTDLTSQLQAITDSIGTKANSANVTAELAKKDNTADVDAKIKTVTDLANTKANSVDVTAALDKKDDTSDVDAKIKVVTDLTNTKANANDVYNRSTVDNAFTEVRGRLSKLEGTQTLDSPDFNGITASGIYYITNNNWTNIKNNPVDQWGVLIVSNGNGHRVSQVYYPDDGNPPWYRSLDESTWHNWIQLSTKQDVNNATNLANAASNKVDTVLANSYVRKQGMNANGDCVEIKHTGIKQANGGYAFDMWSDDWTASKLKDVLGQLPSKANTTDVNNALNGKANTGDVTALQGKVNVTTPLFREISADSTWEDIFGVTNPTNVLTSLRINPGGNGQLVNDFAAGIGFGGNDTKAVISVDYGSHLAKITGGNGTAPSWSEDIAWKSDISSLTQALTKLQAAFDAQQTKIAALQTTVNNQANQLTYFKQHYIEEKAFDADQIKQAMAWTGDDGQKLAIIRDKENEGGK